MKTGIIPAYAGNTFSMSMSAVSDGDHPRVCGEHLWPSIRCKALMGSSPRMRGTRGHGWRRSVCLGIIPAYAGNTSVPCP